MLMLSSPRMPAPIIAARDIKPGSVPPDKRILVEAVTPLVKHRTLPNSMAEDRVKHASIANAFCRHTQYPF